MTQQKKNQKSKGCKDVGTAQNLWPGLILVIFSAP